MASDNVMAALAGAFGGVQDVLGKYVDYRLRSQYDDEKYKRERYIQPEDIPNQMRSEYGIDQPIDSRVLPALTPKYFIDPESGQLTKAPHNTSVLPTVQQKKSPEEELSMFEKKESIKADMAARKAEKNAEVQNEKNIEKLRPKAKTSALKAIADFDRMEAEATAILNDPNLSKATGRSSYFYDSPFGAGTKGRDIGSRIETLKSQSSFSTLQEMRNASPTGGALGNVSDKETQLLSENLTALNKTQSDEGFKKSLERLINYTRGAKERIRRGYSETFNEDLTQDNQNPAKRGSARKATLEDF